MIPVLEIGGTHAVACLVDLAGEGRVTGQHQLDFDGDPDLAQFTEVCRQLVAQVKAEPGFDEPGSGEGGRWGVAIPGPFDYELGIGQYEHVGKFESLTGVDVRALLASVGVESAHFLNDCDAFGLGEAEFGAGAGLDRVLAITLGTGVGSAYVRDGRVIHDGPEVSPEGYAYTIEVDGQPLEDVMSRRALIKAWTERSGRTDDVKQIFDLARSGDADAQAVIEHALDGMARGLAPYIASFGAKALVVGGSIARSWDLVEPVITATLRRNGVDVPVLPAKRPAEAAFLGAAQAAVRAD